MDSGEEVDGGEEDAERQELEEEEEEEEEFGELGEAKDTGESDLGGVEVVEEWRKLGWWW